MCGELMQYIALAELVVLAAAMAGALWERERLLTRADRERQMLLNRIQAPEVAIAQSVEPTEPIVAIDPEDHEMRLLREQWSAR